MGLLDEVNPNWAMACGTALVVVGLVLGYDGTVLATAVGAIFGVGGLAVGKRLGKRETSRKC